MQISNHKVVTIDYTLSDDDGNVLDTSHGGQPLAYIHGTGNIIPGLESALDGKLAGDELQVTVEPEHGYGEHDADMCQIVPRSMFEGVDQLDVGMHFQTMTDAGPRVVTITQVDGDDITVDGNHPLAGVTLNFDVIVREVRDASAEELDHGHVHGPGGHHH